MGKLVKNMIFFINDDAKYISEKYDLKITSFGNDTKCGFPVKSKDKYLKLLKEENIEIVDLMSENDHIKKIIKILNKIDLDNITPKEAINVLYELKGKINNE